MDPINLNDLIDALNDCIEVDTEIRRESGPPKHFVWLDGARTRKVLEEFGVPLEPEAAIEDAAGEGV